MTMYKFNVFSFFVISIIVVSCGSAYRVCENTYQIGYEYKPFAEEGCRVLYSPLCEKGSLYVVVSIESDRLNFTPEPTLLLKNFNGDTIKLEGESLYSKENNGSVTLYNFNSIFPYGLTVPLSEINALARFKIDKSQIHLLLCGIKKVRITTIPIVHEIEFKDDEIGCKLYEKLSNAVSSECAF